MKQYFIANYNEKENTWELINFLEFNKFKKFILQTLKEKGYIFIEPITMSFIKNNGEAGIINTPEICCVLNRENGIYYFINNNDLIENFLNELRIISDKIINKRIEKKLESEIEKNVDEIVKILNHFIYIEKNVVKKDLRSSVGKFLLEVEKISDAMPPSSSDEKKFNEWWAGRERWLSKIKEKIDNGDRYAKDELFKATFIFGISEIIKRYKNDQTLILFLSLVCVGYNDFLKDVGQFDWKNDGLDHYYFDIGNFRSNLYVIEINWIAEEKGKFPYELAEIASSKFINNL